MSTADDFPDPPTTRRSDPDTSHDAAFDAAAMAKTHRALALRTLEAAGNNGLTDFELEAITGVAQTSIGKRRGELRDAGLVTDSGRRRPAPSGSSAIVWIINRGATMTSIPLEVLGSPPEPRRDQWGRYLVVPPNGAKPVGYTRVTTVAKSLDTGGGLANWKASMAMIGAMGRPGLLARWQALVAEHPNPWYGGDEEAKALCKKLVEECATAGGSDDRKEIGSGVLHTITALVDAGKDVKKLSGDVQADVKAYLAALAKAGIQIVPGAIELTVVLDHDQVAGTFDRLVTVPGFDLPLVADLKTGSLDYSWQSIAVQLAAYAAADSIYIQGPATDGSQDQRLPMPAVDQDFGLILHLPTGQATMTCWLVDLDRGRGAYHVSVWAREWRKTNVAIELPPPEDGQQAAEVPPPTPPPDDLLAALGASVALKSSAHDAPGAPQTEAPAPDTGEPSRENAETFECQDDDPIELRRQRKVWVQQRIDDIGSMDEARHDLIARWPADLPSVKNATDEQLAVIVKLCEGVEGRWQFPFPPPEPGSESAAVAKVLNLFPGTTQQQPPTAS